MMRWIYLVAVLGLLGGAIGCGEHTVREPGESEHGGVFLHASPDADKPPTTRKFLFF